MQNMHFIYNIRLLRSTLRLIRSASTASKVIELNEKTLTGRLLLHLHKSDTFCTPTIKSPNISNVNINYTNLSEKERWLKINSLEQEYTHLVDGLDSVEIFQILNTYMQIASNFIIELKFYNEAIRSLYEMLDYLSLEEKLKFIFYVALQKKTKSAQSMIKACLRSMEKNEFEKMKIEDICVICNSAFKTSTKIKNPVLLNKVIDVLNNNLGILKDPAIFITLLKTLRHNRFLNEDILATITCTTFFNSTYECYSFGGLCHIIAAYADFGYFDEPLLKLLSDRCIELLKDSTAQTKRTYMTENIRPKDLKRFLWAFSSLGYELNFNAISEYIVPYIRNGDYHNDPESLIDSVFYLWVMQYQAVDLIPYCFTERNVKMVSENKSKTKQRLNLLLTCILLENLPLYKTIEVKPLPNIYLNMRRQVTIRPNLLNVYNVLCELLPDIQLDSFKYEYQIPYLNIVGITGYRKNYKKVFVEVLDEYVCIKNQDSVPFGLMKLKIRLLNKMEQGLVTVSINDVKEMSAEGLKQFLLEEIKLVI